MSASSTLERCSLAKRDRSTSVDILLSSGNAWRGVTLEEHQLGPGSTGERVVENDFLVLNVGPSDSVDIQLADPPRQGKFVPDSVNVLPRHTRIKSSRWTRRIRYVAVEISEDFVRMLYRARRRPGKLVPQIGLMDPYITAAMLSLRQDVKLGCPGGAVYGESICAALLLHIALKHGARLEGSAPTVVGGRTFDEILAYIEVNLPQPLSVAELAAMAGMAASGFVRAFKAGIGMSPASYITHRRVDEAKVLLEQTTESVCDIALQTGFANQSHFATVFRRFTEMTPSAFRSRVRRPQ